MFIAHVFFAVAPSDRKQALDTLLAEVPAVRRMKGCKVFQPFADPLDPAGLGVIHEWESQEMFAAYAASEGFAEVGKILRPMMTNDPVSRRFDAKPLETVT